MSIIKLIISMSSIVFELDLFEKSVSLFIEFYSKLDPFSGETKEIKINKK